MVTQTKETPHKSSGFLYYRSRIRFAVMRRDNWKCQLCGASVPDGAILEIDHLYPESKSGSYSHRNLITVCRQCNIGKDDTVLNDLEMNQLKEQCRLAELSVLTWDDFGPVLVEGGVK